MGGIPGFNTPKSPAPMVPPAAPPSLTQASQQQQQTSTLRAKRGRGTTMLSGAGGTTATPLVGTKTLLGQ